MSYKIPRNKFEHKVYRQIRRSRLTFKYESERIPYVLAKHYIPDFVITTPTGKLYVECKGYLRPEHKAKMAAVRKQHPELDIRIVFYSINKRYIKWADKIGIKWAIGTIPEEWLKGL